MAGPSQPSIFTGTYVKENHGTVINKVIKVKKGPGRNPKPPEESYGPAMSTRLKPRQKKEVENVIRAEWPTQQEFGETWMADVGTVYSREQSHKLARYFETIGPILDLLP